MLGVPSPVQPASHVSVETTVVHLQSEGGILQGALYTRDFLERGICEEQAWGRLTADTLSVLKARLAGLFVNFAPNYKPNEGVTERDLIYPVLAALGWQDLLVQQQVSTRRRDDVPDALLFGDAEHKASAQREREPFNRYRYGLCVVEAKRWLRPLDRADAQGTPSSQMLRYLRRAEEASDGRLEWGILTNGRYWRLYWQGARSRAEEFLELDLPAILGMPDFSLDLFAASVESDHWLRVFAMMFGRASFLVDAHDRYSFHDHALRQTRKWEAKVAEGLSEQVFGIVYPELIWAIARSLAENVGRRALTDAELEEVRRASLTLLYRLLFVLYAEDRRLLPVDHEGYAVYSLDRIRDDIAERLDRHEVLSDRIGTRYDTLRGLFAAIDKGEPKLGLPPYNGGLFRPVEHRLLETIRLPDSVIALVVDTLSRRQEGERRLRINYRDLSVQQLGSIYERLLEFAVVSDADKIARIQPNLFARKSSGSYYTPDELVRLIVERTIGPLLDERQRAFDEAAARLKSDRRPKAERIAELRTLDPATAFLSLRICDPAMGSGHFLVTLVDVLADRTLPAMDDAKAKSRAALGDDPAYRSPIQDRIEAIRERIRERAMAEGWRVADSQLDDRHIVRRMILKRTVYGVDKNSMAVELAKVSLWLHTFTVGAPLSFLDHHLRCGDSLFGEFVRPVEDLLYRRGSLALARPLRDAKRSVIEMSIVEEMSDADLTEVERSETSFAQVEPATRPLNALLDFFHALRWLDRLPTAKVSGGKGQTKRPASGIPSKADPVASILDGALGDPVDVIAGKGTAVLTVRPRTGEMFPGTKPEQMDLVHPHIDAKKHAEALAILSETRAIAARERFLHWQSAFPGVWDNWESAEPTGGFDAVIGNPPWDRIKLQEVEWFATRRPEIAKQQRASDRTRMIANLKKGADPIYADYERAAEIAESAARVARDSGYYPLMSGGDVNLYSLFVERAQALAKPDGMVGLLVPSGIAADKGASAFFGGIASTGRLAALLDFENRRTRLDLGPFFPDVDNRFKFCAFVTGASRRVFSGAACGFFLQSAVEANDPERVFVLTSQDFVRVNPNTKTAPIFRSRRDAEIVRCIYDRLPILHDHAKRKTWPVRYVRMFDMTNDAGLFRKREELDKEGAYPVESGRVRKGNVEYVPLYEGKMVQAFDHRAASIVLNPENLNRPAQPESATLAQKQNPAWVPVPQYWVNAKEIDLPINTQYVLGFKEITSPTNARTMIAALLPPVAFGNKIPLLLWEHADVNSEMSSQGDAIFLAANLNAFVLDYVTRQKIQGQTLNWFIVEQLPVVPPARYSDKIGRRVIADLVREEVLPLTYTSKDMQPFAEDLGFGGEPFHWDEDDRRHRRARLDAIYFRLYGVAEDDAAYILDTFPIVREQDERVFGCYRTKEMILAYMRAFAAGDTGACIAG
ncbi:MAG: Eco57I restriction-modification methylase domain-containing protein [Alphaproteobacteria bacterium]